MKKLLKRQYDFSNTECHVCGRRMMRNSAKGTVKCTRFGCQVKGVEFNVPFKEVVVK